MNESNNSKDRPIKLWINACEVSGDLQASLLLKSLKVEYPQLEAIGMGGDRLEEVGQKNFFHIKELSVMGITEIVSALPRIFRLWKEIKKKLLGEKPDAIMLVDSGEFNFPLAKFAKKHDIPVYYFIPPKVWAWRKGRIKYLKRDVKTVLCILPFEVDFYKENNIDVVYIQNPLVDVLAPIAKEHYGKEKNPWKVAILPGSRRSEANLLLPVFAETARELQKKYPQMSFHIVKAPNFTEEFLSSIWNTVPQSPKVEYIQPEKRYEFIVECKYCIASSGTATLETALLRVPTLICYKASLLSYIIATILIHTNVGLPNLILDDEVLPEFLQYRVNVTNLSNVISLWIENKDLLNSIEMRLDELNTKMQNPHKNLNIFDDLV